MVNDVSIQLTALHNDWIMLFHLVSFVLISSFNVIELSPCVLLEGGRSEIGVVPFHFTGE